MNKKLCRLCGKLLDIEEFHKKKGTSDGHRSECKECIKSVQKKYRSSDSYKEKRSEYDKKRYAEKREEILEHKKEYYQHNKEILIEKKANYRNNNRYKVRESNKKYQKANNKWRREKYKHVIIWRSILYSTLKRMDTPKAGHTDEMLGYSADQLKIHLENQFTEGMNWENYGEWQVDHIKPVSKFDSNTPVSIVCSLDNLRPMWATTREINGLIYEGNQNKHNKYS